MYRRLHGSDRSTCLGGPSDSFSTRQNSSGLIRNFQGASHTYFVPFLLSTRALAIHKMASLCRRSASGFIASVAGPSVPSRLCIQAPISSGRIFSRSASTRSTTAAPSSPPRSPTKPRPASPFAPSSPARPPVRQTPITPSIAAAKSAWPWRPSQNAPAGYTDLERTIYARPYEGPLGTRVRMLWFLVPFWGLVVGFYLTTPSPPPQRLKGEDGKEIE